MPGSEGWNGMSSERPLVEDYPRRDPSRQEQYGHREEGESELSSKQLEHGSGYYGPSGSDRLTEAEIAFRRERDFEERERERDREFAREKQRERERDIRELQSRDREAREDEEAREYARREPNANNKRALSGSPPGGYGQHAQQQQQQQQQPPPPRYEDEKGMPMKELSHPESSNSERARERDAEVGIRNGSASGNGVGSAHGGSMDGALVPSRNGGGPGGAGLELPTKSLFEAITQNDVREIQLIINSGEDIDAMLPEADTIAIILASKLCFNGIMELLIRGHANLDSQDRKGWTALHWTAVMNNIEGLSLLLNAGANIQARTQAGKSPLDLATIKDHDHAIDFLRRHMDPNRQDLDGDGRDRVVRSCIECGSTKTPQWRRGPDGSVCLCNACGLRHIKSSKKKAKAAGQKPGDAPPGPAQQAQVAQAQAQAQQAQAQAQAQAQQRGMPGGLGGGMGGMGMNPMHDARSPQPRYPMGSPGAPGRPRYQGSFSGDGRAASGPPDHLGYMGAESRANGHSLGSYHAQQLSQSQQQQQREQYRQYGQGGGGGSQGGYY